MIKLIMKMRVLLDKPIYPILQITGFNIQKNEYYINRHARTSYLQLETCKIARARLHYLPYFCCL